jgi:hypothetical protein
MLLKMDPQKNLPTTNTNSQSIALIPPVQLNRLIFEVNQLIPYPLGDTQIEDWASNIKRLSPSTTSDDIRLIMDKFMTGRTIWNKSEGIQNIFRGINLLIIQKGEYLDESAGMKYRIYGEHPNTRKIYENDREF